MFFQPTLVEIPQPRFVCSLLSCFLIRNLTALYLAGTTPGSFQPLSQQFWAHKSSVFSNWVFFMCLHLNPSFVFPQYLARHPTTPHCLFFFSTLTWRFTDLFNLSPRTYDHRIPRVALKRDRMICRETHQVMEPHSSPNPNSFHTIASSHTISPALSVTSVFRVTLIN